MSDAKKKWHFCLGETLDSHLLSNKSHAFFRSGDRRGATVLSGRTEFINGTRAMTKLKHARESDLSEPDRRIFI